jgi:hypothetical protein
VTATSTENIYILFHHHRQQLKNIFRVLLKTRLAQGKRKARRRALRIMGARTNLEELDTSSFEQDKVRTDKTDRDKQDKTGTCRTDIRLDKTETDRTRQRQITTGGIGSKHRQRQEVQAAQAGQDGTDRIRQDR